MSGEAGKGSRRRQMRITWLEYERKFKAIRWGNVKKPKKQRRRNDKKT